MDAKRSHFDCIIPPRWDLDLEGDGVESNNENMLRRGGAEFDPANVNGSDSGYPEISVEEVSKPSTLRGRGCGCGRKM